MKNSTKAFVMTIITFIATAISTHGMPTDGNGWIILGITVLGTTLIYLAKNAVFPSISLIGTIDTRDLISGAILAVGTAISNWVATVIAGQVIDWHSLRTLMFSVVTGYFISKFATQPKELSTN